MTDTASFPHADLQTSRVGFGCASMMRVTSAKGRQDLLAAAYDSGIRHFDVARLYGLGAAEGELGTFARGRRDEITIATKFGIDPAGGLGALARFQQPVRALLERYPKLRQAVKRRDEKLLAPRQYDAAHARRSFDTSLRELGVDHVDVLFVHDPSPHDDVHSAELVQFFEEQKAAGKLRAWGVSQDAHPGVDFLSPLGPQALLQVRSDVLAPAPTDAPRISFGVLGGAHAKITAALSAAPELRRRWGTELGSDPLVGGKLAALLLADAAASNPNGALLYSTIRADRIAGAVRAIEQPPSSEVLAAFAQLARTLPAAA